MKKVLVIAGPSAVGKTTVAKHLLSLHEEFEFVRSATTRAPRADGNDSEYIYLTGSEFKESIDNGKMLEFTEYSGNFYGTPLSETDRIFAKGKIPLLILDINGVLSLKNITEKIKSVAVYITADTETLDERLTERARLEGNTEAALTTLKKRKEQNRRDILTVSQNSDKFDAVIRNDNIDFCAKQIYDVFNNCN